MSTKLSKFAVLATVLVISSLTTGAFGQGPAITNPLDAAPTGVTPQIQSLKKAADVDEAEAQKLAAQKQVAAAKIQAANITINNYAGQADVAYQGSQNPGYDGPTRARYSARYRACHSQVVYLTVVRGVAQSDFDTLTRRVDYLYKVVAELRYAASYSYRAIRSMEVAAAAAGYKNLAEYVTHTAAVTKKIEAADAATTPPAGTPPATTGTTPGGPSATTGGAAGGSTTGSTAGTTGGAPGATTGGTPPADTGTTGTPPATTPPAGTPPATTGTTPGGPSATTGGAAGGSTTGSTAGTTGGAPGATTGGTPPATTGTTAGTKPAVPAAPAPYVIDWGKTLELGLLIGVIIALVVIGRRKGWF